MHPHELNLFEMPYSAMMVDPQSATIGILLNTSFLIPKMSLAFLNSSKTITAVLLSSRTCFTCNVQSNRAKFSRKPGARIEATELHCLDSLDGVRTILSILQT